MPEKCQIVECVYALPDGARRFCGPRCAKKYENAKSSITPRAKQLVRHADELNEGALDHLPQYVNEREVVAWARAMRMSLESEPENMRDEEFDAMVKKLEKAPWRAYEDFHRAMIMSGVAAGQVETSSPFALVKEHARDELTEYRRLSWKPAGPLLTLKGQRRLARKHGKAPVERAESNAASRRRRQMKRNAANAAARADMR